MTRHEQARITAKAKAKWYSLTDKQRRARNGQDYSTEIEQAYSEYKLQDNVLAQLPLDEVNV